MCSKMRSWLNYFRGFRMWLTRTSSKASEGMWLTRTSSEASEGEGEQQDSGEMYCEFKNNCDRGGKDCKTTKKRIHLYAFLAGNESIHFAMEIDHGKIIFVIKFGLNHNSRNGYFVLAHRVFIRRDPRVD